MQKTLTQSIKLQPPDALLPASAGSQQSLEAFDSLFMLLKDYFQPFPLFFSLTTFYSTIFSSIWAGDLVFHIRDYIKAVEWMIP
jgi:hypothetical protein